MIELDKILQLARYLFYLNANRLFRFVSRQIFTLHVFFNEIKISMKLFRIKVRI